MGLEAVEGFWQKDFFFEMFLSSLFIFNLVQIN